MKYGHLGVCLSVAVHAALLTALFCVPLGRYSPAKTLVLDFAILQGRGEGTGGAGCSGVDKSSDGSRKRAPGKRSEEYVKAPVAHRAAGSLNDVKEPAGRASQGRAEMEAGTEKALTKVEASDPGGQVAMSGLSGKTSGITGESAGFLSQVASSGPGRGSGASGSGTSGQGGQGRLVHYGDGSGGSGGAFSFIREAIMRNVRYPDKARRLGWEGKVILSFIVSVSGSIRDVKVVQSSGFAVLDDSAKDALTKTVFSRKIPARLVVVLPVEYRLKRTNQ